MTEESDRNRACGTLANTDGCRTRKRRCDQKQPYCSNCVRSVVRDQQGLPVCVYSIRRKTARPGSADHLRLLLAQAPAQDGPPLVVNPPSIIHRDFDLGNNDFELQLSASPREDFHEYTYPPIDRPLVISTLPYARQAFSNDHEQLEVNLVRLGHLQSMMRLSVGDINVIYSVVPDMDKLPRAVLFALCAYGVLYSQHEGVFTPGISANRSSVRVQKCRVLIARSEDGVSAGIMRINSAESVVVKEPDCTMDSATCTIALRVCVLYDDTERVSDLDRKFGVFSSSVFENRASLACLSGTELLFQLAGNTTSPTSTQDKHDLSAHDKAVRFLLWSEFMRIDAFISFSTRRVPTIDSNDCDRIVSSIGAHSIQERPLPVPSPRIHAIGMKNLWKNGPFHIMDQDIRRRTFETDWFAIRRESLDMSILVRKLMLENFDLNSQIQVCKVHDELIRWFHGFPQELKPFDTLQVFHEGYLTVNPLGRDVWRLSPASNLDVLLFLACLVRLHLPRMHSIEKCFSVGGEQCSSAKVIIVCFRALVYVILCLYTPIQVEPIVYPVPKPASPEAHDMPAPMLSNAMYAMPMYLVCGSAVLVSRIQEGETWDAQLGPIAEKVVVAALSKIVNIWPGCGEHLLNLQRLMADGDAEFWRKELQR